MRNSKKANKAIPKTTKKVTRQKNNPQKLTKGTDSGAVPDRVKRSVLLAGMGICAATDCENKIRYKKTQLGECAHIIPRKVGSHPREDFITSFAARKSEDNLLYLCEFHHKLVDNVELAESYTTKTLKKWKTEHEAWVSRVKKSESFLPGELQKLIKLATEQLSTSATQGAKHSKELIKKLLDAGREHIGNGRLTEATTILVHVDMLMLDFGSKELEEKASIYSAVLTSKNEDVHSAKKQLLTVLQKNSNSAEAMFEYLDLCIAAPEPKDESSKYEKLLKISSPKDIRLEIFDAIRVFDNLEKAKKFSKKNFPKITHKRLNYRYLIQRAIIFDHCRELGNRNALIKQLEQEYPDNPRVDMFKFVFDVVDVLRADSSLPSLSDCIASSEMRKFQAQQKALLGVRDNLMWDFHELMAHCYRFSLYGVGDNVEPLAIKVLDGLLSCFPDRNILAITHDTLRQVRLPSNKIFEMISFLKKSKVKKSITTYHQLLIQCLSRADTYEQLEDYLKEENQIEILELFNNIKAAQSHLVTKYLTHINDDEFSISLLHHVDNNDLVLEVVSNLAVSEEAKPALHFLKMESFSKAGKYPEALFILNTMNYQNFPPAALQKMETIAWEQKNWGLFIPVALKLCSFELPSKYLSELTAKLSIAYSKEGDDSNCVKYAVQALGRLDDLGETNAETILLLLVDAYLLLQKPDLACEAFNIYKVKPSFALKLTEANALLRTKDSDKYTASGVKVLEAYQLVDTFDDRTFLYAFMSLNEINQKSIQMLPNVEEGSFVKLEELGWFYIGEKTKALGAVAINSGENYNALIGKAFTQTIAWPSDKYAKPGHFRTIQFILTPLAYLSARAAESMDKLAALGNDSIWSVQALKEDGSVDIDTLNAFMKERNANSDSFFKIYCEKTLPLYYLAASQGSLTRAISKISSEEKGFIHCNLGTKDDLKRQADAVRSVLDGAPCVLDGLSALVLCEAELLDAVTKEIPSLSVPASVIREIRKIAMDFDPNKQALGRGDYTGGRMQFSERNIDKENILFKKLLSGADILDNLVNKRVVKCKSHDTDGFLPKNVPQSLSDAFSLAIEDEAYLITDDAIICKAYEILEKKNPINNISSFSLVRGLFERKIIKLTEYLKFYSLLTGHRYRLLPISDDELMSTIMPLSVSGLVIPSPKNIEFLQLQFTLSEAYGVDKITSLRIITSFLTKVIMDNSIPKEFADAVFAYTIVRYLGTHDTKIKANTIAEVCRRKVESNPLCTTTTKEKLNILIQQLSKFSDAFDPIFRNIPELIKVIIPNSEGHIDA